MALANIRIALFGALAFFAAAAANADSSCYWLGDGNSAASEMLGGSTASAPYLNNGGFIAAPVAAVPAGHGNAWNAAASSPASSRVSTLLAGDSGEPLNAALSSSFSWRTVNGQSYVTSIKNQGSTGECVAFATISILETKYMLTRNDAAFAPNFSEQHYVCAGVVGVSSGGWPVTQYNYDGSIYNIGTLNYLQDSGVTNEATLPWTGTGTSPYWPLSSTAPLYTINSFATLSRSSSSIRNALNNYGAVLIAVYVTGYDTGGGIYGQLSTGTTTFSTSGTSSGDDYRVNHAVNIVGYCDTASAPGGGYYIVKNSWGTGVGSSGYFYLTYASFAKKGNAWAIDGPAYCVSAAATATWSGSSNVWSAGGTNWTSGGGAYTWVNQETAATFAGTSSNSAVTISSAAIAYGLTFASGAAGYSFTGGSLTVDHGGIAADESVTINSGVSVGAPQTWTVAAGKTLAVNGTLHTLISDLTLANSGTLYLAGGIDGGGLLNFQGVAPGSIVQTGTGTTYITGASNATTNLTVAAGSVVFSGQSLQLGGTMIVGSSSTAAFTQTSGTTTVAALYLGYNAAGNGTLNLNGGALAVNSISKGSGAATLNFGGGTLQANAAVSTSLPINLTGIGGNAVVDTQNFTVTFSGSLSGSGGLTKTGTGTLTLSAANAFTGTTSAVAGTLRLNNALALQNSTYATGGGSLNFGTLTSAVFGGLTAAGADDTLALKNLAGSGVALSVGNNNQSTVYIGRLTGAGSLTKIGSGTLTLSGANSQNGAIYLNSGALVFQGDAIASALATSAVTNISTGTKLIFDYTGGDSVADSVRTALATSYNDGVNSFASGVLRSTSANADGYALGWRDNTTIQNVTVQVTLFGDADFDGLVNEDDLIKVLTNYGSAGIWTTGDFTYDSLVDENDLIKMLANYGTSLAGVNEMLAQFSGRLGEQAIASLQAAGFSVVPEPGTLALLAAALLGLLVYALRKKTA